MRKSSVGASVLHFTTLIMVKVSVLCLQLLREYDSLMKEHEGMKVTDLLLELKHDILVI